MKTEALLEAARNAAHKAHTPYSHYKSRRGSVMFGWSRFLLAATWKRLLRGSQSAPSGPLFLQRLLPVGVICGCWKSARGWKAAAIDRSDAAYE
ncbi:MAG: hypothetical protein PWQ29_640 [Verrucomicrobiota bacterium]|jgi:hypothetical protein|nr:hypothetical protein [Verrucomicrobiota bacterium]MDK2963246.1 hypothetical protein [Verrucomicrobiota bacterium]